LRPTWAKPPAKPYSDDSLLSPSRRLSPVLSVLRKPNHLIFTLPTPNTAYLPDGPQTALDKNLLLVEHSTQ
jgi:hypothetical protein